MSNEYINSSYISAYPNAKRNTGKARNMYEAAFVNVSNAIVDKDNFMITRTFNADNPIEFIINGYYFKVSQGRYLSNFFGTTTPADVLNLYAGIKLTDGENNTYVELIGQDEERPTCTLEISPELATGRISVSIDAGIFKSKVGASSYIIGTAHTFSYTSSASYIGWLHNSTQITCPIADYGLTIAGTPIAGDTITVTPTDSAGSQMYTGLEVSTSVQSDWDYYLHVLCKNSTDTIYIPQASIFKFDEESLDFSIDGGRILMN